MAHILYIVLLALVAVAVIGAEQIANAAGAIQVGGWLLAIVCLAGAIICVAHDYNPDILDLIGLD